MKKYFPILLFSISAFAGTKISQFPSTNSIGAGDTFPVIAGGANKQITFGNLENLFPASSATNDLGTVSKNVGGAAAIGANFSSLGLDSNAVYYCYSVGITDVVNIQKISGFVLTLKNAGLYSALKEARFERPNLNNNTMLTFFGAYGTNCGSSNVVYNKDGALFNLYGTNQGLVYPIPSVTTHSFIMGMRGTTNEPGDLANKYICPWNLFNIAGLTTADVSCIMGFPGATPQLYTRQAGTANATNGWASVGYSFAGYYSDDPRYRTLGVGYNSVTPNFVPYVDGRMGSTISAPNVTAVSTSLNMLSIGCRVVSLPNTIDYYWQGTISYWALFNIVLTPTQIAAVEDAFRYLDPWTKNRVFLGDSLTSWHYNDGFGHVTAYRDWPSVHTELVGTNEDYRNYNVSSDGEQASAWVANIAWPQQYSPRGAVKSTTAYVILGVNDAFLGTGNNYTPDTVATFWPNISNVWQSLKSSGDYVIGSTISCVWSNAAFPSNTWWNFNGQEGIRRQYNDAIITNAWMIDELRPLHTLFSLDEMNTNLSSHISRDGLHWWLDGADGSYGNGPVRVAELMFSGNKPRLLASGAAIYTSTNYYTTNFVNGSLIVTPTGQAYVASNGVVVLLGSGSGNGNGFPLTTDANFNQFSGTNIYSLQFAAGTNGGYIYLPAPTGGGSAGGISNNAGPIYSSGDITTIARLSSTNFIAPTNTPVDGYVATASGTTGKSYWAPTSSGSGFPLTADGDGNQKQITNLIKLVVTDTNGGVITMTAPTGSGSTGGLTNLSGGGIYTSNTVDGTITYLTPHGHFKRIDQEGTVSLTSTNGVFDISPTNANSGLHFTNRDLTIAGRLSSTNFIAPTNTPINGYSVLADGTSGKTYYGQPTASVPLSCIGITVDGAGSAITLGTKGFLVMPAAGTITGVEMLADQNGSIQIETWRTNSGNLTLLARAGSLGTNWLTSTNWSRDVTLTGWSSLALAANDIIGFQVTTNASSCTRVTLQIKYQP